MFGLVLSEGDVRYVGSVRQHRRSSTSPDRGTGSGDGLVPLIGRFFPAPVAAKVPEVIFVFWVVKILTTAGGEATSDYLKTYGNFEGGGIEVLVIVVGLVLQFETRRYRAFAYWSLAYAIAITGTGVSDFLHLDVHIPYAGTTLLWAVILAAIFWLWQRSEGTLSIHSITTQRREAYYWATVFATFALGTALGDFTATSLNLGYLDSGILFGVIILIPALARWQFGLNGIAAFWMSYVSRGRSVRPSPTTSASPRTSAGSTSATAPRRSCSPWPSSSSSPTSPSPARTSRSHWLSTRHRHNRCPWCPISSTRANPRSRWSNSSARPAVRGSHLAGPRPVRRPRSSIHPQMGAVRADERM